MEYDFVCPLLQMNALTATPGKGKGARVAAREQQKEGWDDGLSALW